MYVLVATLEGKQTLPAMACCKILQPGNHLDVQQDQSLSHCVDWIITVMDNKKKAEEEKQMWQGQQDNIIKMKGFIMITLQDGNIFYNYSANERKYLYFVIFIF